MSGSSTLSGNSLYFSVAEPRRPSAQRSGASPAMTDIWKPNAETGRSRRRTGRRPSLFTLLRVTEVMRTFIWPRLVSAVHRGGWGFRGQQMFAPRLRALRDLERRDAVHRTRAETLRREHREV